MLELCYDWGKNCQEEVGLLKNPSIFIKITEQKACTVIGMHTVKCDNLYGYCSH